MIERDIKTDLQNLEMALSDLVFDFELKHDVDVIALKIKNGTDVHSKTLRPIHAIKVQISI